MGHLEIMEAAREMLITDWINGDVPLLVQSDEEMKKLVETSEIEVIYLPKPYMGLTAYIEVIDVESLLSADDDTHHAVCVVLPHVHGYGPSPEAACKSLVRMLVSHHEFLRTVRARTTRLDRLRDMLDNVVRLFPDRAPTLRKKRAPNRLKED